ncbi:MAG: SMP-30/gluconolactonase/LRE family protein [Acetobacteraceae bacterium]
MESFVILDPRFRAFVLPNAPLVKLAEGFAWPEGPVWFGDQECLLVSDLPNDRIMRWTEQSGWFSDPQYGINTDYEGGKQAPELPPTLYRLDPRDGTLAVVADDFDGPNGLCFSPDECRLYVAESGRQFAADPVQHIRAFDVVGDRLANGRVFHKVEPGFADGFRCDEDGHLWSSAADGVHCIDPSGALLGKILVPSTVANLTFGGRNRSRLFLCASHTLYAIYINQRGAQRP